MTAPHTLGTLNALMALVAAPPGHALDTLMSLDAIGPRSYTRSPKTKKQRAARAKAKAGRKMRKGQRRG